MASSRITLNAQSCPGTWSITGLVLTETAGDVANKNRIKLSGNDILIAHNTDVSAHTITIDSVPDPYGRSGSVSALSLAAGELRLFRYKDMTGWQQPSGDDSGYMTLETNSATVKFIVVKEL